MHIHICPTEIMAFMMMIEAIKYQTIYFVEYAKDLLA